VGVLVVEGAILERDEVVIDGVAGLLDFAFLGGGLYRP
jgi:hypothetical protein